MNPKLVALKLILDSLEIPDSIDTIDDRKRVQKAIYLGQRAGVDLGYRFGWYLKGPYCTDLTRDYYALAEAVQDGEVDYESRQLVEPARSRLGRIIGLMQPPEGVALKQEDWLELVASTDYLLRVRRYDEKQAKATLEREKSHLVPYYQQALDALRAVDLLPIEQQRDERPVLRS